MTHHAPYIQFQVYSGLMQPTGTSERLELLARHQESFQHTTMAASSWNATHDTFISTEAGVDDLTMLDVSHNDITHVSLIPVGQVIAYPLTSLDLSYAKLSSLEDVALGCLSTLRTLNPIHNSL